jgi:hypothetical protein
MAALPDRLSVVGSTEKRVHLYDGEASVLKGELRQPVQEEIRPQAFVKLPKDGQYQYRQADPFHVEGILSYKGGYAQVAGYPSSKHNAFVTLSTSVIEGLNVLDVLTADRVVAQISTEHPRDRGQVPSVTFLGTRFENLRIAGHRIEIDHDFDILGPRSKDDHSYLDDDGVKNRIGGQRNNVVKMTDTDGWAEENCPSISAANNGHRELRCSLVNGVKSCPGFPFGHVIHLPQFGTIVLGDLTVTQTYGDPNAGSHDQYRFRLTMIKLKLGCLAEGSVSASAADSNGSGSKGGGN